MDDSFATQEKRQLPPKILLTGRPGVGKSTVVQEAVAAIGVDAGGFYTREVRHGERRTGFELVTLGGVAVPLAQTRPHSFTWAQPFGRYSVNLDAIERVAIPAMREAWENKRLVVIDEIGPMELLSGSFHRIVLQILESDVAVLGTLMKKSHRLADVIRRHPAVTLIEVTLGNREHLPQELVKQFAGHSDREA
jgi:nucleoside-triphosphatase